jgi:hypothetical protein
MPDPNPYDQFDTPAAPTGSPQPLVIGTVRPPKPQEKTVQKGFVVDPNSATAVPIAGLPQDHWVPLPKTDPRYTPDHPAEINTATGETRYGPQESTTPDNSGFGVQDYTGVLGDIGRLREQAAAAPDAAFGPGSATIAHTFAIGTPGASLRSIYNGVSGKALREALISTNQAMGGSGAASIDRTASGLQAMRASALHGLDPDLQTKDQFLKSLDQLQQDYTEKLAAAAKASGGTLMRQVTQINGQPITPIEVPYDATDDQVRDAVRKAGYDVHDSVSVDKGFSSPVIAPSNGKTVIDLSGGNGSPPAPSSGPQPPQGPSGPSSGGIGDFLSNIPAALQAATDKAGNLATYGLAAPLAAGVEDVGGRVGQFLGLNPSGAGTNFDANLARLRAEQEAQTKGHTIANAIGDVAGVIAGAPRVAVAAPSLVAERLGLTAAPEAATAIAPKGAGIVNRAVRGGLAAAPVGAIEGAANAGDGHRIKGAIDGGGIALGVGMVATPVIDAAGSVTGWALNRLMPNGQWAVLSHLAPEATPADMRAAAQQARAAGTNPAALDTLNESSLDQVRNNVGGRPGSQATTILNNEAEARVKAAPGRVVAQARKAIGAPPVPVEGDTAASPQALRADLSQKAGTQFQQALAPIAGERVPLTDDLINQLSRPQGLNIVKQARTLPLSPEAEAELSALPGQLGQSLDMKKWLEGFPENMRTQIEAKMGEKPSDLSLEALNAIRQVSYHKPGGNIPGVAQGISGVHQAARDAGVQAVPAYAPILEKYAEQAGVAHSPVSGNPEDAIALGENLLGANSEGARAQAGTLNLDKPVKFEPDGQAPAQLTPRQAAGEGVVRAVELKANKAGGLQSLDQSMKSGEQRIANRTVLTPQQASTLESGVTAEAKRVVSANRATPASAPSPDNGDNAAHAIATMLYHSPALKVAKSMSLIQKAKISPAQADAIAKGIVDPKQTDAIISQIEKAGYTRQRARSLYGMLALQLGAAAGRTATRQ